MKSKKEKIAIVTGGSRGIGLAIAKKLVEKKYKVLIVSENKKQLKEAGEQLNIDTYLADFSKPKKISALAKWINNTYPHINLLVNNAGILDKNELKDSLSKNVEEQFQVNANSGFFLSHGIKKKLNKVRNPRVIFMCSGVAAFPTFMGIYGLSKSLMLHYARLLAISFENWHVIPMSPGWIRTEMTGKEAPNSIEDKIDEIMQGILKSTKNKFSYYGKEYDFLSYNPTTEVLNLDK